MKQSQSVLFNFNLTKTQIFCLDRWVAGNFQSDWVGLPQPGTALTAEGMTRAALESTVGQGFFPGIEAGIITTDATIYNRPFDFRLDHGQVRPGDLTALMALPWQADFLDCQGGWWPAQRPDDVRVSAASTNRLPWHRGATSYQGMVDNFGKLGFITAQTDAAGKVVFAEDQRAVSEVVA